MRLKTAHGTGQVVVAGPCVLELKTTVWSAPYLRADDDVLSADRDRHGLWKRNMYSCLASVGTRPLAE